MPAHEVRSREVGIDLAEPLSVVDSTSRRLAVMLTPALSRRSMRPWVCITSSTAAPTSGSWLTSAVIPVRGSAVPGKCGMEALRPDDRGGYGYHGHVPLARALTVSSPIPLAAAGNDGDLPGLLSSWGSTFHGPVAEAPYESFWDREKTMIADAHDPGTLPSVRPSGCRSRR